MGKAYFSETLSTSFHDPRLTLLYDDAARYLREEGSKQNYDVIICDSSDPVGVYLTASQHISPNRSNFFLMIIIIIFF